MKLKENCTNNKANKQKFATRTENYEMFAEGRKEESFGNYKIEPGRIKKRITGI